MRKNNATYARIFMYICALLSLLLVVTQFLPFWNCSECEDSSISVSDYVWFPSDYEEFTDAMKAENALGKTYQLNDWVLTPVVIIVGCALSIIFCIKNSTNSTFGLFPFIAGLTGVVGYLTTPILQMGANWTLHLAAAGALLACSIVVMVDLVITLIQKYKEFRAEVAAGVRAIR